MGPKRRHHSAGTPLSAQTIHPTRSRAPLIKPPQLVLDNKLTLIPKEVRDAATKLRRSTRGGKVILQRFAAADGPVLVFLETLGTESEALALTKLGGLLRNYPLMLEHPYVWSIIRRLYKEYVSTRREEGAANGTINRELACLKRMFKLALQSTPSKVARIPHIPMLEEHNVRSGFFSHEEYLAVRGVLPDYAQVAVSIAYYTGLRIGEVLGLKWSQVDLGEGKLSLTPLQTKTETSRVVYLPPDLHLVLLEARRLQATYPASPWVCQRYGERLLEIKRCWKQACRRMGLEGRLVHDFRRTAVRNMTRAWIPEKVAMAISGHKTRSVFDRYNIVNETDLKVAAKALATYYEQEKVTLSVTLAELSRLRNGSLNREPVETSAGFMEPAIRIERTTCGLRISDKGVAQVFDDMGNPLSFQAIRTFHCSVLVGSLCR